MKPYKGPLMTAAVCAAMAICPVACKTPPPKVKVKVQKKVTLITARGGRKFDDSGTTVRKADMNRDGQPDLWKIFRTVTRDGKPVQQLIRMELDINYDGKIDIYRFYNAASELVREEMDLDFDGKIDVATIFELGRIVRKELSQGFDEGVKVWKHYENGRLVRVERITKRRGTMPDTFEIYLDGEIASIGYDRDGDGKPDVWQKLKEDEAITAETPKKPGADGGTKKAAPPDTKKAAPKGPPNASSAAAKKPGLPGAKTAAPEKSASPGIKPSP